MTLSDLFLNEVHCAQPPSTVQYIVERLVDFQSIPLRDVFAAIVNPVFEPFVGKSIYTEDAEKILEALELYTNFLTWPTKTGLVRHFSELLRLPPRDLGVLAFSTEDQAQVAAAELRFNLGSAGMVPVEFADVGCNVPVTVLDLKSANSWIACRFGDNFSGGGSSGSIQFSNNQFWQLSVAANSPVTGAAANNLAIKTGRGTTTWSTTGSPMITNTAFYSTPTIPLAPSPGILSTFPSSFDPAPSLFIDPNHEGVVTANEVDALISKLAKERASRLRTRASRSKVFGDLTSAT